jgi:hypothetical protein
VTSEIPSTTNTPNVDGRDTSTSAVSSEIQSTFSYFFFLQNMNIT